jgi:hypothetical protein
MAHVDLSAPVSPSATPPRHLDHVPIVVHLDDLGMSGALFEKRHTRSRVRRARMTGLDTTGCV